MITPSTVEMPVEGDTVMSLRKSPLERAFANLNGLPAEVHAVKLKQVESAKRNGIVLAAVAEQIEDGEAVCVEAMASPSTRHELAGNAAMAAAARGKRWARSKPFRVLLPERGRIAGLNGIEQVAVEEV